MSAGKSNSCWEEEASLTQAVVPYEYSVRIGILP